MTKLKLIAFDTEDLNVVSAHLQDAIVRVGDMALLPREKRFAAVFNRFDWGRLLAAGDGSGDATAELARLRTALRFERVLSAQLAGIDLTRSDDVLVLLALSFERKGSDDPSGTVMLTFAGQAAIKLDVECLESEMKDLGPTWAARARPSHPIDDDPGQPQSG
jgi:hypothetical protein